MSAACAGDEFRTLSRTDFTAFADAFIAVAADQPGEYWTAAHFLRDLPEKWILSFAVWSEGGPIGYAVLSAKAPDRAHLHHFMVAAARRGTGLGTRMAAEMERRARIGGYRRLTLKAERRNAGSLRFYERLGFRRIAEEGDYALLEKHLT